MSISNIPVAVFAAYVLSCLLTLIALPLSCLSFHWLIKYKNQEFLRIRGSTRQVVFAAVISIYTLICVPFLLNYSLFALNDEIDLYQSGSKLDKTNEYILLTKLILLAAMAVSLASQRAVMFAKVKLASYVSVNQNHLLQCTYSKL